MPVCCYVRDVRLRLRSGQPQLATAIPEITSIVDWRSRLASATKFIAQTDLARLVASALADGPQVVFLPAAYAAPDAPLDTAGRPRPCPPSSPHGSTVRGARGSDSAPASARFPGYACATQATAPGCLVTMRRTAYLKDTACVPPTHPIGLFEIFHHRRRREGFKTFFGSHQGASSCPPSPLPPTIPLSSTRRRRKPNRSLAPCQS
jgi:hypothetical protein